MFPEYTFPQNISGVEQAAQSTSTGAHELNAATQQLERLSSELLSLVGQFKYAMN
jgi:methyl-accepting chemotaxis protein